MKYRIKQVDHNIYIPQVKQNFFDNWLGIDNRWDERWWDKDNQTRYCGKKTFEDALLEIEIWKTNNHKKINYPKYFKL